MTLKQANQAILDWHRHHKPVLAARLAVGAYVAAELQGVAVVENPRAAPLNDGKTWEVTRLSVREDAEKNVASRLLGACWRASKALGIERLVSYTRADESGHSYLASGWTRAATVKGREWNTGNKRTRWLPGMYEPSTEMIDRVRWEIRND
jgi:hypothetical protein